MCGGLWCCRQKGVAAADGSRPACVQSIMLFFLAFFCESASVVALPLMDNTKD